MNQRLAFSARFFVVGSASCSGRGGDGGRRAASGGVGGSDVPESGSAHSMFQVIGKFS